MYRLGATADILPRHGACGLYTSTPFQYRCGLFDRFGPALELGPWCWSVGHQRAAEWMGEPGESTRVFSASRQLRRAVSQD